MVPLIKSLNLILHSFSVSHLYFDKKRNKTDNRNLICHENGKMYLKNVRTKLILFHYIRAKLSDLNIHDRFRILFSGTSNVCHSTAECPPNAICEPRGGGISYMEGQCVCRNGYFMKASGKSRKCIEIADFGELCYMNEQCQFRLGHESHCDDRTRQCACRTGAHYVLTENACFNSSSE